MTNCPSHLTLLALFLSSAVIGCGDKTPGDDEQEDTAADADTDTDANTDTDTDTDAAGHLEPLTSFVDESGTCVADSDGVVDWSGKGIYSYNTVGYDGSLRPPLSSVKTCRYDSVTGCDGETSGYRSTSPGSGSIDPQTGDVWFAYTGPGTLGDCYMGGSCGNDEATSCSGAWKVELLPESGRTCDEYDTVRIDLEPRYSYALRRANDNADCVAGSGRFELFPLNRRDRDHDGEWAVTFLPLQVSGTGVMTNHAWITEIDKVSAPEGYTLRVIKPNIFYTFTGSDLLTAPATVSYAITGSHQFSSGSFSGNAPFVVDEVSPSDIHDFVVDMSWTCGSVPNPITQPLGYQFKLSDIGCDPAQKITMRYLTNPNRVNIEQYGNPNYAFSSPTTTVEDGEAFSITMGWLHLEGVITSLTEEQAEVEYTEITYDGKSVCTPDTYTFGVE